MLAHSIPITAAEDGVRGSPPGSLLDRIVYQKGSSLLDLSLCRLKEAPVDEILSHYGKPDNLDLSYNHIPSLPLSFPLKLGTLTRLDLSRNELKRLPDNFGLMDQLTYLDVHRNQLQTLPLSMERMKRLTYLDITENVFQSPLCNFLHSEQLLRASQEVEPPDYAECANKVVSLLTKLSGEVFTFQDHSSASPAPRRGVSFDTDEDEDNAARLPINRRGRREYNIGKERSEDITQRDAAMAMPPPTDLQQNKLWTSLPLGICLILLAVILFPVLTAFCYSTPYLDDKAGSYAIWKFYKPFHATAQSILETLYLVKTPPPPLESGNFILTGFHNTMDSVRNMFASSSSR